MAAASGRLEPGKLEELHRRFVERGVVVLGNALPVAALDALRPILDANTVRQEVDPAWEGMIVPRHAPWVSPEICCSPILEQCAAAFLGTAGVPEGVLLTIYQSNTNLPGTDSVQEMHMDDHWDWPDAAAAASADQPHPHGAWTLAPGALSLTACNEIQRMSMHLNESRRISTKSNKFPRISTNFNEFRSP